MKDAAPFYCRHVAKDVTPGVVLPAYLAPRTGRDFPCLCADCGAIFMGVLCPDGVYRDYRDVDYGGRRP